MPTQATLAKPDSVVRIAPTSGVFGSSLYVGDEEGFCAKVLGKWYCQINNTFALETPQHIEAARLLYDFYVEYRAKVDTGLLASNGSRGRVLRALGATGNITSALEAMNKEVALEA
ncbi:MULTISPECIES: hypothetical protein [Halomonadaceae]|uniref:hypothetical protein n=1 Tax=Halomonadaceae TaxID=28256 RepID=UPI003CF8D688